MEAVDGGLFCWQRGVLPTAVGTLADLTGPRVWRQAGDNARQPGKGGPAAIVFVAEVAMMMTRALPHFTWHSANFLQWCSLFSYANLMFTFSFYLILGGMLSWCPLSDMR